MLTVEYIINPVAPADFYRINLINVKMCRRLLHVFFRDVALVILIGYKILDWN